MKKKDLLFVGLLVAVLLAYPYVDRKFVAKIFPPKERPAAAETARAPEIPGESALSAPEAAAGADATAPEGAGSAAGTAPAVAEEAAEAAEEPREETVFTLENGDLRLVLTSAGAGVKRAEMLGFPLEENGTEPVAFDFSGRVSGGAFVKGAAAGAAFEAKKTGERSVEFRRKLAGGVEWTRTMELREKGFVVDVADRFRNGGGTAVSLEGFGLQTGTMGNLPGEKRERLPLLGADTLTGGRSVDFWGGKFEKWFPGQGRGEQTMTLMNGKAGPASVDWVAVKDKYFTQILTPEGNFAERCEISAWRGEPETVRSMLFFTRTQVPLEGVAARMTLPAQEIAAGGELTQASTLYIGPKEYGFLKANGYHQEDILQLGFWRPIGILILKIMVFFHDKIPPHNYGLAIILLTFLIRIVFWPLNRKSMLSTRRMQEIQPELAALKERYKKDPQRQQQEMMKLYREKKINPMGGCLPMLIQIPVFFALFIVLRGAIELRHSSFLWIRDLSTPENLFADTLPFALNLLPIFMGFTMWLQQRMTPTSDPQQQKMMLMMPIIFTLMFYSFPSGLSLYWTVNQIMMIVQLALMKRKPAR